MPVDAEALRSLFQQAVEDGFAPGVQYTVFDKDSTLISDALGFARVPTEVDEGVKMTKDTFCWLASCSKLSLSLLVLHVLEKGLAKDGCKLSDLDSPEALLRSLPEFDPKSSFNVSKILTGFGPLDPSTGKLTPILIPRKTSPTIRQMLNHTAGLAYPWTHHKDAFKWYTPGQDEGLPQSAMANITGEISDLDMPSVREAGEMWEYSPSLDWMAIWLERVTGKSCRELHRQILFEPLDIVGAIDTYLPDEAQATRAAVHIKDPEGKLVSIPFSIWSCPSVPAQGKFNFGSGMLHGTHEALSRTYQACMRRDERVLSPSTWKMALADDIESIDIKVPSPLVVSMIPYLISSVEQFNPGSIDVPSLLSTFVNKTITNSNKPAKSNSWLGLANSFYAFNEEANIGYAFGLSSFPCASEKVIQLRNSVERLVFAAKKGTGEDEKIINGKKGVLFAY